MRTITVLEHEVVPILDPSKGHAGTPGSQSELCFTEQEASALLALNEIRPGFCERTRIGVKLSQYCGILTLQTCVIEILPKVGVDNTRSPSELINARTALLTMLQRARRLTVTKLGPVLQDAASAPLLDVFVEAFLSSALDQARRGLLSRYVPHRDDLPLIRGRLAVKDHIRKNFGRPHLLLCEYDEFTADNPYNRAIRAALDVSRSWIVRESTQRMWWEAHGRFSSIMSMRMTAGDVASLPLNRTTRHYREVLTWSELILSAASPILASGPTSAPGFLFDMNKLFEAYVASLETAVASENHVATFQGPPRMLAKSQLGDAFLLKPDISICEIASDAEMLRVARILDAKWKRLSLTATNWNINQADIYQLIAYAVRYNCRDLELVYPRPIEWDERIEQSLAYTIPISAGGISESINIRVRTVALWTSA